MLISGITHHHNWLIYADARMTMTGGEGLSNTSLALDNTALYCTVSCAVLYCTAQHCTAQSCTAL